MGKQWGNLTVRHTKISFTSHCLVQFATWYLWGRRCTMQPCVCLLWKERWCWHQEQKDQTPFQADFHSFYLKGKKQRCSILYLCCKDMQECMYCIVKTLLHWGAGRGPTTGDNTKAEKRTGWGREGSESENKSKTNLWSGTRRAATQEGLMRSRRLWNYVAFEWGEWP